MILFKDSVHTHSLIHRARLGLRCCATKIVADKYNIPLTKSFTILPTPPLLCLLPERMVEAEVEGSFHFLYFPTFPEEQT